MFGKSIDILSIGDTTTDAFIHLKDPHIHCTVDKHGEEICMPFGAKIPFESVTVVKAVGNSANASVSAARLGLNSALLSDLGDDQNGKDCLVQLRNNNVSTTYVKVHKGKPSNYHFVLWYDSDRTILINHVEYDYKLQNFPEPKWIYLSSLAPNARMYHTEIADYLESHPKVKLAFQPGTFQIGLGVEELKRIYARTELLIINLEEAQTILQTDNRDVKALLKKLASYGPKLVAITDGMNGAYLFDGDHYYFMPIYPDPKPPLERTGCGDAWSSTFMAALALGKTPLEALIWAPINSMSVVQYVGAQEGLLSLEQLTWWLERAPADYKPREI